MIGEVDPRLFGAGCLGVIERPRDELPKRPRIRHINARPSIDLALYTPVQGIRIRRQPVTLSEPRVILSLSKDACVLNRELDRLVR